MSVFRVEKNKNFTVMSNYHLKDTNLSLKAKGLLSLMLSLPDNWDYTIKGLATICKDGVDSIKATVKELEKNGYILRERIRNEKGHLTGIEYTIYEEPKRVKDTEKSEEPSEENNNVEALNESSMVPEMEKSLLVEVEESLPKVEKTLLDNPKQEAPKVGLPEVGKPILENPIQLNTKQSIINVLSTNLSITNQSNPNQSNNADDGNDSDTEGDLKNKYDVYLEFIKSNIEYDFLCENNKCQKDSIDEIIEIMLEIICTKKQIVNIAGEQIPAEIVKSKFLKINQFHIEYILECLSKNTTKINNIKSYLKACIYNAPSTMASYYSATVNYDMYGDKSC